MTMKPDLLDLIERYARERVQQALAEANGYPGRAIMCRDNARDILRELTQELGISHENFWRGE